MLNLLFSLKTFFPYFLVPFSGGPSPTRSTKSEMEISERAATTFPMFQILSLFFFFVSTMALSSRLFPPLVLFFSFSSSIFPFPFASLSLSLLAPDVQMSIVEWIQNGETRDRIGLRIASAATANQKPFGVLYKRLNVIRDTAGVSL